MVDLVKLRLLSLLLIAAPALAGMTDPTRPPPGYSAQGTVQVAEPPLLVTSVFLMGERPYALVDGMTVRVGDRLGDGRVNRIEEQGVWLQTRAGKRLLGLVPGIDKKLAHQEPAGLE